MSAETEKMLDRYDELRDDRAVYTLTADETIEMYELRSEILRRMGAEK